MLTLTLLYLLFSGGNSTEPEVIEVPEYVNLSNSIFYGGENPRYIYKEDIEELDRIASEYQDVEIVYVEY